MTHPNSVPRQQRSFNSNQAGARIVKVAALCFAILSWYATAEGLAMYVFDHKWQAQLVSFGVQGILYVLNLKLPYYFAHIGIPSSAKKLFSNLFRLVLLIFYGLAIIFSSSFSFVFIANSVVYGHDSGYIDANTVLNNSYQSIVESTKEYVSENIKATQTIAGKQLAELQSEMGINSDDGMQSLEELEKAAAEATTAYDNACAIADNATEFCDEKRNYRDSLYDGRFLYLIEYQVAQDEYENALRAQEQSYIARNDAKAKLEAAQKALADWKKSDSSITGTFLVELLSESPDPNTLKNNMSILMDRVTKMGESGSIPPNYATIVQKAQALRITLQQYQILSEAYANDTLSNASKEQPAQSVAIPSPDSPTFSEDKLAWQNCWQQRYHELKEQIQPLPTYDSATTAYLNGDQINTDLLNAYVKDQIIAGIDNLVRQHTTDINVIERAVDLLWGEYPFAAWFSLAIAVFLDLSSLLAGMFLYGMSSSTSVKKQSIDSHTLSPISL